MSSLCVYKDDGIFFHHSVDESPDESAFYMHAHEWNEVLVVLSGKGFFLVEGNKYPVDTGSVFIMRAGETHKMTVFSDTPYERFSIHFDDSILSEIDKEGELLVPFEKRKLGINNLVSPSFPEEKYSAIGKLDMSSPRTRVRMTIISFLLSALLDISDGFMPDESAGDNSIYGRNFEIIDFVNQNLSEDLSLEYLSSKFYVSKSQINRTFRKITGTTLWDYVIIKRLLLAKSYIKNGMQISEAYKKCGFNDYSSFYRAYVKKFSSSPKKLK